MGFKLSLTMKYYVILKCISTERAFSWVIIWLILFFVKQTPLIGKQTNEDQHKI